MCIESSSFCSIDKYNIQKPKFQFIVENDVRFSLKIDIHLEKVVRCLIKELLSIVFKYGLLNFVFEIRLRNDRADQTDPLITEARRALECSALALKVADMATPTRSQEQFSTHALGDTINFYTKFLESNFSSCWYYQTKESSASTGEFAGKLLVKQVLYQDQYLWFLLCVKV